jgi:transcriptional regulator with XRE-family HTH domain
MHKRRVSKVGNDIAEALRLALEKGFLAPAEACKVLRSLEGCSQKDFAARLGINVKVIRALESGSGSPRYDSLGKIAEPFGLRVAFVKPSVDVEIMDPDERAAEKHRRREADADALASGRMSPRELLQRNELRVGDVSFELPELP